jgi:hypothetical protein
VLDTENCCWATMATDVIEGEKLWWAEVGVVGRLRGVGGESIGRHAGEGERTARWMARDGENSCCGDGCV